MAVGLVSRKLAERAAYFEIILIFLGGVIGTGHHLYWAGGPSMWVPMGSMFSFIEVLPLVLLIIEAIQHHRLISATQRVQVRPGLHLHHRRCVLEFRRRRRVRRRHAECAAGELLRARHLPDAEPCSHRAVRRLRPAGDRADLLLSALCRRRGGIPSERSSGGGPSGSTTVAWSCGSCSTSFRSAGRNSTRSMSMGWPMRAARVLRYDAVLAVDAAAWRRRVRHRRIADGLGFHHQASPALSAGPGSADLQGAAAGAWTRGCGMTSAMARLAEPWEDALLLGR